MTMVSLSTVTPHPVDMEVFEPPAGTPPLGKSVVVAYGTDGLSPASKKLIEDFCRDDLAKAGYTAVLPRYFESTKTTPGVGGVSSALTATNLKAWTSALVEAVKWCSNKQGSDKVAVLGLSLGGYMAARAALATPVKLLIDFFGPMTQFGKNPLTGAGMPYPAGEEMTNLKAKGLPPTQIHHGLHDSVVAPSESTQLEAWLTAAGITCQHFGKYASGHPQDPEGTPWTSVEQRQATPRVLTFLTKM